MQDLELIRGGTVVTMDGAAGGPAVAGLLVEESRIAGIAPNLRAPGAGEIDARGRIVCPGLIDWSAWTASRSALAPRPRPLPSASG